MDRGRLPRLTIQGVEYGAKETPWDLEPLLYKGGASVRVNLAKAHVESGKAGFPVADRIPLLVKIHEVIEGNIAAGSSKSSQIGVLDALRRFFRWADENDAELGLQGIESTYLIWADSLLHRVRVVKDISEFGAYAAATRIGRCIDCVLERAKPILFTCSLKRPPSRPSALAIKAEKQSLSDTFSFGAMLLDICEGLTLEAFWGPLPVRIPLRSGGEVVEHSMPGRRDWPHPLISSPAGRRAEAKQKAKRHAAHEADRTLRTRYPLANLRIEAELLIFIAQTGMNLAQAHLLRIDQYSYTSSTDGYQVRSYKHRRNGPVLFEIFGEYREIFERYLAWRRAVFKNDPDELLFPLIRRSRHITTTPNFGRVVDICKRQDISYVAPQKLRRTRVNWLLRRSRDPDLTAEMDQHTKKTLLKIYEEPSLQVAMTEVTRFWAEHDPALAAPAPGACVGATPEPLPNIPVGATEPDCLTPAGCIWCQHQRDIDSFDHVWNLCTYRYLKTLEITSIRTPTRQGQLTSQHPAALAVDRLTMKLSAFKESSLVRMQWVEEGLTRIDEDHYHPNWSAIINNMN